MQKEAKKKKENILLINEIEEKIKDINSKEKIRKYKKKKKYKKKQKKRKKIFYYLMK